MVGLLDRPDHRASTALDQLQLVLVKVIKPCISQGASCSQGAELTAELESWAIQLSTLHA